MRSGAIRCRSMMAAISITSSRKKRRATGTYEARIAVNGVNCATALFKKDAYRLPKFQVRLDAPKTIPLDKPATVGMTATYYAGGAANDRPVRWRITQFPYAFTPKAREGFVYATDTKYQSLDPDSKAPRRWNHPARPMPRAETI